jgi:Predicted transcriptional regulators
MVAVDETGRTVGAIPFEQAADLAHREVQHAGRLGGRESTAQDVVEDEEPVLRSGVQDDRLPRFHTIEGDKVTGRLWGDTFTGRRHELSLSLDVRPRKALPLRPIYAGRILEGRVIQLAVDRNSGTPVYEQISDQLAILISTAQLSPSQRLPAPRAFASQLQVNRHTISSAYPRGGRTATTGGRPRRPRIHPCRPWVRPNVCPRR